VSMPKANMYQSLHTTVIGPEGERIEIQIRTEDMHKLAENGVAAHWRYKDSGKAKSKDAERFNWLRQILDWQREMHNPREFLTSLKSALHQDEVYVFTPRGEVKELPEGATPVDFAYQIHSQVGDRCAGAKVNGRLVPLTTALKNGDTVEIITDPHRTPSRDWLNSVKTPKARARIKHFVKTEERARSIALAKEVMEKEGRKVGVNFAKVLKEGALAEIAKEFSFTDVEEFLSAIGYAKIPPKRVLRRLAPEPVQPEKAETRPGDRTEKTGEKGQDKADRAEGKPQPRTEKELKAAGESSSTRIKGMDDVLVRYAGCCDPLPGEPIVGYVSKGKGYTVHTASCPNLLGLESDRLVSLSWENEGHAKPYPGRVRIVTRNVKGVLAKVSGVLADLDVNIDAGSIRSMVDGNAELNLTVEVKDAAHLYKAIDVIRKLDFVREITRVSGGNQV
jgi:GTP diphosphokinase / guanosine-3',5'-bis(diphosphate) 3'-diphosphatase